MRFVRASFQHCLRTCGLAHLILTKTAEFKERAVSDTETVMLASCFDCAVGRACL